MNVLKTNPVSAGNSYPLNTDQFAEFNQVKSQTVRKRLCETGSYFGEVPKKLANGRLAWRHVQVEARSVNNAV